MSFRALERLVGVKGFEPPTFGLDTRRSNQAELYPHYQALYQLLFINLIKPCPEVNKKLQIKKQIEHYRKVLLALKSRNIRAMLTLHHFTLPLWLAEIGGFSNKKSIFYFLRFAIKVFSEYKDLVDFWITFNEPLVFAVRGYLDGAWLPKKKNTFLFLKVLKNQITAHKKIYKEFHSKKFDVQIGIAKNNVYLEPENKNYLLDRLSASISRYLWNKYFLNRVKNHSDFIGLNYYFHNKIKFIWENKNENKSISDIGWEIYPKGIYYVLKELQEYRLPIYVTENGLADAKDNLRADFIKNHLYWIYKAIEEGINIKGYFHWSLMDNFEWEKGFGPKFGLVEVDYNTLERTPRPSALYYAQICKNNSLLL